MPDNRLTVLSLEQFKQSMKDKATLPAVFGLRKQYITEIEEVKEPDTAELTLQFVISTGSVDRDQDTISADGWKLENYMRNPVVLFAHDYRSLPVARAPQTWMEGGKLRSRAQFTPKDLYPFGYMVYEFYKQGFMKAISVGFQPLKYAFSADRERGVDFLEQDLLEYSAVPVPSNPEALLDAKSKGIDTVPLKEWCEQYLDTFHEEKGLWVPKSKVERAFEILNTTKSFVINVDTKVEPAELLKLAKRLAKDELKSVVDELVKDVYDNAGIAGEPPAPDTPPTGGDEPLVLTLAADPNPDEGHTKFNIDEETLKGIVAQEMKDALARITGKIQ